MAKTAVVSSKGQITLPKELRVRHRLNEGSTVVILETDDGILIRPGYRSLGGIAKEIDAENAEREIRTLRKKWTL